MSPFRALRSQYESDDEEITGIVGVGKEPAAKYRTARTLGQRADGEASG